MRTSGRVASYEGGARPASARSLCRATPQENCDLEQLVGGRVRSTAEPLADGLLGFAKGAGQIVVIFEVIAGYLTLGLLVSILANKVAWRS